MPTTARIHPGDGDPRHGTRNGYGNLKCRCEPCRAAQRRPGVVPLKIHLARVHAAAQEINHGTHYAYGSRGCRCKPCTRANTEHARDVRDARRRRA